ncbi:hypothetical protein BDK51DRAFT_32765, partial [Blyttiomyces helicus]
SDCNWENDPSNPSSAIANPANALNCQDPAAVPPFEIPPASRGNANESHAPLFTLPPLASRAPVHCPPLENYASGFLRREERKHLGKGRRLRVPEVVKEMVVAERADFDVSPPRALVLIFLKEVESIQRTDHKTYCFEVVAKDQIFLISCKTDKEFYSWMDEIFLARASAHHLGSTGSVEAV